MAPVIANVRRHMQDTLGVDKFMGPFREALDSLGLEKDQRTKVYNRAWEAVHNAIVASQPSVQSDASCRCDPRIVGYFNTFNGPMCTACGKIRTP